MANKKRWNLAIWYNMDRPWGYYAKSDNSYGENQMPYDFTCMWNLKSKWTNNNNNQTCRYRGQSGDYHKRKFTGEGEMSKRGSTVW